MTSNAASSPAGNMASTTGVSAADALGVQSRVNGADVPQQNVEWLFVIMEKGRPILYNLQLKVGQTGATVMQVLKKEYEGTKPFHRWFHGNVQLEDAIISPYCIGDPEAQDYPRKVIIESSTLRPDLTEAFHNPALLRGTEFIRKHEQFSVVTGPGSTGRPCHAILIKKATSQYKIAGVVAVVVLLSIAIGIATGFLVHDGKVGLAACAGLVGIFALIQASLFGADSLRSDKIR